MNIGICDDEKYIREYLKQLILSCNPELNVSLYDTGEALLCEQRPMDIIFLDIRLTAMSGLETAKILRETNHNTVIIFITGKKEYVFDAFDVEAFHYLLKPVKEEKFFEVLKRAVMEAENRTKSRERILLVKTKQGNQTVNIHDILYAENDRRRIILHTWKEEIVFYSKMEELEARLGKVFFRCHRGYLVNMDYISIYDRESIRLKNGETIYMSKQKYQMFVESYLHYLRNGGGNLA